eukprot:6184574-Pleurochrysis_carterae.AAC.2
MGVGAQQSVQRPLVTGARGRYMCDGEAVHHRECVRSSDLEEAVACARTCVCAFVPRQCAYARIRERAGGRVCTRSSL